MGIYLTRHTPRLPFLASPSPTAIPREITFFGGYRGPLPLFFQATPHAQEEATQSLPTPMEKMSSDEVVERVDEPLVPARPSRLTGKSQL